MKALICKTQEHIYVCNECEALWKADQTPITPENDLRFRLYLKSQGLEPTWDSIKVIEEEADV